MTRVFAAPQHSGGRRRGSKDYMPLGISVVNWMRQFQSANTRNIKFYVSPCDCSGQTHAAPHDETPLILSVIGFHLVTWKSKLLSGFPSTGLIVISNCPCQQDYHAIANSFLVHAHYQVVQKRYTSCAMQALRPIHFHLEMCNN